MRTSRSCLLILLLILLAGCGRRKTPSASSVEGEFLRIAGADTLWPGFDPISVPLAIFDGTKTHLFRHPAPPGEFQETKGAFVLGGRHPAIVANSSARIGDVITATLILQPPLSDLSAKEIAAVGLHEAFHVFQGKTERSWGANETDLFTYPVDDVLALILRRTETQALRRAFASQSEEEMAGWAQAALDARSRRFARIDAPFSAYERGIELGEGTAAYIEHKAAGRDDPDFPVGGFAPENVRSRAYVTGVSWALLLDRFKPEWRRGFARDDDRYLDTELADALRAAKKLRAQFGAAEQSRLAVAARADVETLRVRRGRLRTRFESAPGWQLVVETDPSTPLWPQGFDPMNVERVEGGILHTRFLKLGNETGNLEVMGDTVLTEGIGPHPLFNGVKRVILTGIEDEPDVDALGDSVSLQLPAVTATFLGAKIERQEKRIHVMLGAGQAPPGP